MSEKSDAFLNKSDAQESKIEVNFDALYRGRLISHVTHFAK